MFFHSHCVGILVLCKNIIFNAKTKLHKDTFYQTIQSPYKEIKETEASEVLEKGAHINEQPKPVMKGKFKISPKKKKKL